MTMISKVIYGPVLLMAKYRNLLVRDDDTEADPVDFGVPLLEPVGVVNRRAAIAYPFRPKHLLRLRKILIANGEFGAPLGIDAADALPGDWRYPVLP